MTVLGVTCEQGVEEREESLPVPHLVDSRLGPKATLGRSPGGASSRIIQFPFTMTGRKVVAWHLCRGVMDVVELYAIRHHREGPRYQEMGASQQASIPLGVSRCTHAIGRVTLVLKMEELDPNDPGHPIGENCEQSCSRAADGPQGRIEKASRDKRIRWMLKNWKNPEDERAEHARQHEGIADKTISKSQVRPQFGVLLLAEPDR